MPGFGRILALTILYEIQDIRRFERVQDFLSYSRLVKCDHRSAGKKLGTGGAKIGNAHLKWAFSEAAALFLRNNPAGQKYLGRLTGKHGKGRALSIPAAGGSPWGLDIRPILRLRARTSDFEPERSLNALP